jgi:hypothetical protein
MLARFERLMEQAVEGSLRRVFPTTLQPVQLAKAAARAMEEAQVIGLRGPEVPNRYRLRLAPADLERFGDYTATLARELSRYLVDYAHERGLRPIAEPRVELLVDTGLRTGSVRADARFVDLAPAQKTEIEDAVEGTRRLRLADLAAASPSAPVANPEHGLWLADPFDLRFALEPAEASVVRIGRASDNDVVIGNQRVSRYHAQLRWVESSWLVDEQRVSPSQPRVLGAGVTLRLGDHDLHVDERPPAG